MVNDVGNWLFGIMLVTLGLALGVILGAHLVTINIHKTAIEAGVAYEEYNYKERTLEFKWKKLEKKDG